VKYWNIERMPGLSDLAAKSQDYLCGLADRYRALAERVSITGEDRFSWVFNRQVG
jgi:acyl-[acyl-carrier-protein] desaturase